jgi:hypothetical protein
MARTSFGTRVQLGRQQRKRTPAARSRLPSLDHFYRYALPPMTPGDFTFELTLLRARQKPLDITINCESFTWNESSSEMTGNLQLHRSDPANPNTLPIERGASVRCRVRWEGSWYVLWTMRVKPPESQLEENSTSVDLLDDMDLIKRTKRAWSFRKTKHRKFGYFPEEIVRIACKRQGIKTGAIAKGKHRVPSITLKKASVLDVCKRAYAHEKQKTGRSFVIRIRDGKLEIVPLKRNPLVYILSKQIQSALLAQEAASETPATVWTGRARLDKGKDAKKISYTDFNRKVVAKLGYVHHEHDYGKVDSRADLKSKVQRDLAKALKVTRTAQVQYQGIPFIRRGDGAKLDLPGEGFKGKDAFVYATTAAHTVQGATYTSTWDFTTEDPFVVLREQAEKEQRDAKRKERKRTKTKVAGKA